MHRQHGLCCVEVLATERDQVGVAGDRGCAENPGSLPAQEF